MNFFQMLPEIVRTRPNFVLGKTAVECTSIVLCTGSVLGMATAHVSVNVIWGAETFGTSTAWDGAAMGLLVLLFMFPSKGS